jgi:outer membrane immunogenic protein
MKQKLLILTVIACGMLYSLDIQAQDRANNRVGFFLATGSGDIDQVGIGGIAEFAIHDRITLSPNILLYFPESNAFYKWSFWEINFNGNYYFYNKDIFEFYGLAGLNYTRVKVKEKFGNENSRSDGEVGLNLGGGINFQIGKTFVPFSEVRLTIGEFDQFVISAGLKFNLN